MARHLLRCLILGYVSWIACHGLAIPAGRTATTPGSAGGRQQTTQGAAGRCFRASPSCGIPRAWPPPRFLWNSMADIVDDRDGEDEEEGGGGVGDDNDDSEQPPLFDERSQMMGFISDYLRKQEDEGTSDSRRAASAGIGTAADADNDDDIMDDGNGEEERGNRNAREDEYLVAVPLDSCHELGLELESVQRAVLLRCPVLVHACIPMAATRLPLLYVSTAAASSPSSSSLPTSASSRNDRQHELRELQNIVRDAVRRVVYDDPDGNGDEGSNDRTPGDVRRDDGRPDVEGANEDGIRPVLVPFSTLEIDGDGNRVLYTVGGASSPGTRTLAQLVRELQRSIGAALPGWTTRVPEDPARAKKHAPSRDGERATPPSSFRPRVPFVRLPDNWDDYLDSTQEFLTSDQGGNGISPILWGQWMDDEFGGPARMREVGIYAPRREGGPLTEEALYRVPDRVVELPAGNSELAKVERQFAVYQDERLRSAEERERQIAQPQPAASGTPMRGATAIVVDDEATGDERGLLNTPLDKYDALFTRALDSLESMYADEDPDVQEHPSEGSAARDDDTETRNAEGSGIEHGKTSVRVSGQAKSVVSPVLDENYGGDDDDEARDRRRRVIESRARIQTEKNLLAKRKQDKPPLEENPVFAMYKNGTLVPSGANRPSSAPGRPLPPFPSDEHVVGFWRVVRSPTGFAPEEGDSSRSDNLILRVDGTTAGGPILDSETRQKASGGTWKLTVVNDNNDTASSDGSQGSKTASLRIRLVIPPHKDRILVMQGTLERVSMSGSDLPLAPRGTFGVPEWEERASRSANAQKQDAEDLVYCSGSVFVEDAMTHLNRKEIGTFTLQKLFTPTDPAQYTITIPRPVRNQD